MLIRPILLFLYIPLAFALESSDEFSTRILKAYNKNVLVLSRGLEDGIYKKDHIKLTSDDGFMARAICIKVGMETSHWKVYRVTRPELISKDRIYTLISINQSKLPSNIARISKINFDKYFNKYGDNNLGRQVEFQQERIAQFDLPNTIQSTADFNKKNKTVLDNFIENNFEKTQVTEDLKDIVVSIYADPIKDETRYEKSQAKFGAQIKNLGKKHRFEINFDEDQTHYEAYYERKTSIDASYTLARSTDNISVFATYNFDKQFDGKIYFPKARHQIAIIGLKYHIYEDHPKDEFAEISYAPTYDRLQYMDLGNNEESVEGLSHVFKLRYHTLISENLKLKSLFRWQQTNYFEVQGQTQNYRFFDMAVGLAYKLNKYFDIEYKIDYEDNQFLKDAYNIQRDNTVRSLFINFSYLL